MICTISKRQLLSFLVIFSLLAPAISRAEYDRQGKVEEKPSFEDREIPDNNERKRKRKFFIEDTSRVDAGVFHVGFMAGGNFFIEPKFLATGAPAGDNFKDFGFQFGLVMDYDYEDTPLGLRGYVGYHYVLNSVHKLAVDFTARMLIKMSQSANFALGLGVRSSFWYRFDTSQTLGEEFLFMPFWLLEAGFDFNPFMVDFKFPVHRIGVNSTILGIELNFGVRI